MKIPGSTDYRINLNMSIVDSFGNKVKTVNRSKFNLVMFGKKQTVDLKWLSLVSYYEVGTIPFVEKHIFKIKFQNIVSKYLKLRAKHLMYFKEPIYYKPGYRIVPNYTRYAVSKDGIVINTLTNEIIEHKKDHFGYITVYIYSPNRKANREIKLHRVIAMAWIPNDDYSIRNIINHIDGVKTNNNINNLEWCTQKENSQHAHDTGLINDNIPMKIRNRYTKEITTFPSVSAMSKYLGMKHIIGNGYVNKLPGYLFKDKYEIKFLSDNTMWFYENPNIDDSVKGKSIFLLTVYNKDTGITKIYNNVRIMCKRLKINVTVTGIDNIINDIMNRFPKYKITYVKYGINGPYHVYNINNKTVDILKTINDVAKFINIDRNMIRADLSLNNKYIYNKEWIVQLEDNIGNYDDYVDKKSVSNAVIVTDISTNKQTKFKSERDVSRELGIERKTLKYRILSGKPYKGYKFRTA